MKLWRISYKVFISVPTRIKQNHPRGTHKQTDLKKWLPMATRQKEKEKKKGEKENTRTSQNLWTDTWVPQQPTTNIILNPWQAECHLVYFGQILNIVYLAWLPRDLGIGVCAHWLGLSSNWLL